MTEVQDPTLFHQRLERLERENRNLKILGLVGALSLTGALFLGSSAPPAKAPGSTAAPAKTIEAETIVVKDPQGRGKIILSVGDDGPAVTLVDKNGKLRANLGMTQDGPALDLLDAAESPRAELLFHEQNGPLLNFFDSKGAQVSFRP